MSFAMNVKDLKSSSVLSMYENRAILKYKRGEVTGCIEGKTSSV